MILLHKKFDCQPLVDIRSSLPPGKTKTVKGGTWQAVTRPDLAAPDTLDRQGAGSIWS